MKKKQGEYSRSKVAYVKLEKTIKEVFKERKVGVYARAVYLALSVEISSYGDTVSLSKRELSDISGCSERSVAKAIKELKEAGLIEYEPINGSKNVYKLNYSFMGIKEKTYARDAQVGGTTYAPDAQVRARVYNIPTYKTKKLQQKVVDVFFNKIKFKDKSPFCAIKQKSLDRFIRKYGYDFVQETVTNLENVNPKIHTSASALLSKALADGDWCYENVKVEKIERKLEENKRLERIFEEKHTQTVSDNPDILEFKTHFFNKSYSELMKMEVAN